MTKIILHTGRTLDLTWAKALIENPTRIADLADLARVLLDEVVAADAHITALEKE